MTERPEILCALKVSRVLKHPAWKHSTLYCSFSAARIIGRVFNLDAGCASDQISMRSFDRVRPPNEIYPTQCAIYNRPGRVKRCLEREKNNVTLFTGVNWYFVVSQVVNRYFMYQLCSFVSYLHQIMQRLCSFVSHRHQIMY